MRAASLHCVVPYFNAHRWESRPRLHRDFMAWIETFGVTVYVVELVIGDRDFEVTQAGHPRHLQLRSHVDVPWIKENLVNLAERRLLPDDAKYLAWVDGDIRLENPDWPTETLHELQHAPVVQMFSHAIDLGPEYQAVPQEKDPTDFVRESFVSAYHRRRLAGDEGYMREHCGFAWAMRRHTFRKLGGLLDWSIVGSADWQMANAFIGRSSKAIHQSTTDGYKRRNAVFQARCDRFVQKNVGFVPGLVRHSWHGRKRDRHYVSRWSVLLDHSFDPDFDLEYRGDGLLQFVPHKPALIQAVRDYGASRNEDSIDVE